MQHVAVETTKAQCATVPPKNQNCIILMKKDERKTQRVVERMAQFRNIFLCSLLVGEKRARKLPLNYVELQSNFSPRLHTPQFLTPSREFPSLLMSRSTLPRTWYRQSLRFIKIPPPRREQNNNKKLNLYVESLARFFSRLRSECRLIKKNCFESGRSFSFLILMIN